MEIIIGAVVGLVLGLIIGLVLGLAKGKKSIAARVKHILKKENIAIDLDQMLGKKHAEVVKEDFFDIPSS